MLKGETKPIVNIKVPTENIINTSSKNLMNLKKIQRQQNQFPSEWQKLQEYNAKKQKFFTTTHQQ